MNDLVAVMLRYLTQRCNIWGLHSHDEDLIKVSVSALLSRDEKLDVEEVFQWLIENGWEERAATKFKLIVGLLLEGKKIKINDIMNAPTEKAMLKIFDSLRVNENTKLHA